MIVWTALFALIIVIAAAFFFGWLRGKLWDATDMDDEG